MNPNSALKKKSRLWRHPVGHPIKWFQRSRSIIKVIRANEFFVEGYRWAITRSWNRNHSFADRYFLRRLIHTPFRWRLFTGRFVFEAEWTRLSIVRRCTEWNRGSGTPTEWKIDDHWTVSQQDVGRSRCKVLQGSTDSDRLAAAWSYPLQASVSVCARAAFLRSAPILTDSQFRLQTHFEWHEKKIELSRSYVVLISEMVT